MYEFVYRHVLARVPPERAHRVAAVGLRAATAPAPVRRRLRSAALRGGDLLAADAFGLRFPSPLGVAAGLDKDASWFSGLGAIGFGFVEVGTVTPRAQPGNPQPRIARVLADRALVNAMGFPNDGLDVVTARLAGRDRGPNGTLVGVNVGKNLTTPVDAAADDYAAVVRGIAQLADYLVLNVSSPNTPGLRALEAAAALEPLLAAVQAALAETSTPRTPLLVKISPDLPDGEVDAVAALALRAGVAGVIATNTSVDRGLLSPTGAAEVATFTGGGVSGPPVALRSLAVLRRLHAQLAGSGLAIVSVGGVTTADDVWERIRAGASLVQAYTGFVYGGPGWPARINRELAERVRKAGAASLAELVGSG